MSKFVNVEYAPCPMAKRCRPWGHCVSFFGFTLCGALTPHIHILWRRAESAELGEAELGQGTRGPGGRGRVEGGGMRAGPSHTALRVPGLKTSRTNKGSRVGSKKVPVSSTHFSHCWWAG